MVFPEGTGPGPGERGRQKDIILLVTASVYKRSQTAAAPTQSLPCSTHKSVNTEGQGTQLIKQDWGLMLHIIHLAYD